MLRERSFIMLLLYVVLCFRAMLEVGFEGEAGTGFGPTLEFYSTVSREIQKASLKLWNGTPVTLQDSAGALPSSLLFGSF